MASENFPKKMLDGWYCRSIANMQANEAANAGNGSTAEPPEAHDSPRDYSSDSSGHSSSDGDSEPDYRLRYLHMKRNLKYLIYENEYYQDTLRCCQSKLAAVARDRTFLLDRLLVYEKGDSSSSDSEDTESSDDGVEYRRTEAIKRKRLESHGIAALNRNTPIKRKRPVVAKKPPNISQLNQPGGVMSKISPGLSLGLSTDGHMTPEEVERHLQSRQSYLELLPERAPPTVPTEMFSNDPSLDSESNDVLENSPNVEEWFD